MASEPTRPHWLDKLPAALAVIEELRAHGCYSCEVSAEADNESYRCRKCRTLIAFADACRPLSPGAPEP